VVRGGGGLEAGLAGLLTELAAKFSSACETDWRLSVALMLSATSAMD